MASARVSTSRLVPVRTGARESPAPRRRVGALVEPDERTIHARGVGQILDTALDVLVSRFGACVGIAAFFWLPYRLVAELIRTSDVSFQVQVIWGASSMVPEVLTTACVCSFVGGFLLRDRVSAADAIRSGLVAGVGLVLIAGMQLVATFFLALCCAVPALLGYWLFSMVPTVYVLDRKALVRERASGLVGPVRWFAGIVVSMQRAMQLAMGRGSFGRWVGWASVSALVVVLPLSFLPFALDEPTVRMFMEDTLAIEGRPLELTLSAISAIFIGVGTAYIAILNTVYYVDERVRKEALDLELRLGSLVRRAAPPSGR
jgi:hypothetical protein